MQILECDLAQRAQKRILCVLPIIQIVYVLLRRQKARRPSRYGEAAASQRIRWAMLIIEILCLLS